MRLAFSVKTQANNGTDALFLNFLEANLAVFSGPVAGVAAGSTHREADAGDGGKCRPADGQAGRQRRGQSLIVAQRRIRCLAALAE